MDRHGLVLGARRGSGGSLLAKLLVFPGKYPWELRLRFPFNERLKDDLKAYPGVQWRTAAWGGKDWHAPVEALAHIRRVAAGFGHEVDESTLPTLPDVVGPAPLLNPRLWPFQQEHVTKALAALPREGAFILNNEMGLGKSPECIELLRLTAPEGILILCPAMVREDWARKLDEWWPGHPEVTVVRDGKQAAAAGPGGILLTSYGLLPKLPKLAFGAVVFDELHYLQGESAARTLVAQRLLRSQATPPIAVGLTGTLITNQPLSIWKPLDVLFPGRFGTRNGFGARYCLSDTTGFGSSYHGVLPEGVAELRSRLERFTARSTKADPDVARLLPPFLVDRAYVPRRGRASGAVERAIDNIANGARKQVILTHRRDLAREIASGLGKRLGVHHGGAAPEVSGDRAVSADADQRVVRVGVVTGEVPPPLRDKLLTELGSCVSGAVLCATMHSVGIGIDLTWAEEVILAELDYSPTAVLQALGRFSRLSGKRGVRVTVLLQEGGDPVGEALASKVAAAGQLVESGQAGSVVEGLGDRGAPALSEPEMDAFLRGMASEVEDE